MQYKEKSINNLDEFLVYYRQTLPNTDASAIETSIQLIHQHSHHKEIFHNTNTETLAVQIAEILAALQTEEETIAAGILYPLLHWENMDNPKVLKQAPSNIIQMIRNVSKLCTIDTHYLPNNHSRNSQADTLRKMILAIVDDPRAVLIKLAEKIVWLAAVKEDPCIDKQQAGEITMQLYAPLANRLGVWQLKWQLEDLAFRYLDPERYFGISKSLKMRRIEREAFVTEMKTTITSLFYDAGIRNINLTGRAKHIYSIHRKVTRKKISINEIFDSTALRILVNSIKDCYEALSIIHTQWRPVEGEFDDYIAKPKPNGYRSIHTAVTVPDRGHVEVQIRTFNMHDAAELGVAAHWKYKEGGFTKDSFEDKIALLRELLDWQKNQNQALDTNAYQNIFGDRVYVFSPTGEVFSLPAGSTALDFAYLVHTQIGHRCQGAKINGKLSPLTQPLKTGDHLHIMTGKNDKPSRDWINPHLGYLQTNQAINKVRLYFRKESYDENLSIGEVLWEKSCRRTGFKRNVLEKLYSRFNFKSTKDLLVALGANDITINAINSAVKELEPAAHKPDTTPALSPATPSNLTQPKGFIISGVENLVTNIGKCCRPIPGDGIIGYITQGRGITIHKKQCRNIEHAQQHCADRLIEVDWGNQTRFTVNLRVLAHERQSLVNDITTIIVRSNAKLLGLSTFTDTLKNITTVDINLEISALDDLSRLTHKLNEINDLIEIKRS